MNEFGMPIDKCPLLLASCRSLKVHVLGETYQCFIYIQGWKLTLARGKLNLCWATLCDHSSRPAGDLSKIHGQVIFFLESPTLAYVCIWQVGSDSPCVNKRCVFIGSCCTIPDLIVAQGNTCYRLLWFEWLCSGQVEGE